jgi:D-glutamate cyclase
MPEILGENIDRLCTVEIRRRQGQRGFVSRLYAAAKARMGERSLTHTAAETLLNRTRGGSYVFITAGAGGPPELPKGEIDGMLGGAVLARALSFGLGAKPVLVAEQRYRDPFIAATQAAGLPVLDADLVENRRYGAILEPLPDEERDAREAVADLFRKYEPSAVIAVEKPAPNEKGVFHTMSGIADPGEISFAWLLVDEAKSRGIPSIGVGDGGNEIGMGLIKDTVREILQYGKKCQCPCQSGIASIVSTDVLVVANISNWGAYGIAASLACLHGDVNTLPSPSVLRLMFEDCARAGALDGSTSQQILADDGVPLETHEEVLSILRSIVAIGGISRPV